MARRTRMAMSSDFLDAFAKLPRAQQRGVRTLISRFNADSTASGLNYEKIRTARDPAMRSLRIDQGYRAIVLKPDHGDVHMLLWADKHDAAYAWAGRHECRINPETGALQVYEPRTEPAAGTRPPTGAATGHAATGHAATGAATGHAADPAAADAATADAATADATAAANAATGHAAATADAAANAEVAATANAAAPPAFGKLRDRELARLGVPPAMLAEVRTVRDDTDLDAMQPRLPLEAYEALFLFLAGESYEQLVRDREAPPEPVDTGDFAAALARGESRGRFVVVEDELELEAMLNAPLERWRVFLHPSQRRLVERRWNGPARVLGAAGTGKTVVAMHRARWLARNLPGRGRILFTTFTKNLAADIRHNLGAICRPDELDRIEVANLDRWVVRLLRGRRYDFRIVFGRDPDAWRRALDLKPPDLNLPDGFFDDEWEQVVQAHGVTTRDDYLRVPRVGRGTRLNRAARAGAWRVFDEYRTQLAERGLKEVDDAYRDAAALLRNDPEALDYAAVIVDEGQDMGAPAYRLLRAVAPAGADDIFVVGDGHQRIYGRHRVVLGRCGIDVRGRSRKLRLNYRTTEETRRWAARLLAGRPIDDLDGGPDDDRGITSLTRGPEPLVRHFETRGEQSAFIVDYLKRIQTEDGSLRGVCVVARTRRERDAVAAELDRHDLAHVALEAGAVDAAEADGVRLATMHRVKGLEFDRVVMASINADMVPLPTAIDARGDAVERDSAETEERALVYVAATRAKKELLVLSFESPSRLL